MDLKKSFGTNKKKEVEGVWHDGPDGARFLIARSGNENFMKLSKQLMKPYRRLIQIGQADDKKINEITCEVIARTVLLNWERVKVDGKEVPYSTEAAKKALLEYDDFADFISGLSAQIAAYQDEADKAEAGN